MPDEVGKRRGQPVVNVEMTDKEMLIFAWMSHVASYVAKNPALVAHNPVVLQAALLVKANGEESVALMDKMMKLAILMETDNV